MVRSSPRLLVLLVHCLVVVALWAGVGATEAAAARLAGTPTLAHAVVDASVRPDDRTLPADPGPADESRSETDDELEDGEIAEGQTLGAPVAAPAGIARPLVLSRVPAEVPGALYTSERVRNPAHREHRPSLARGPPQA